MEGVLGAPGAEVLGVLGGVWGPGGGWGLCVSLGVTHRLRPWGDIPVLQLEGDGDGGSGVPLSLLLALPGLCRGEGGQVRGGARPDAWIPPR